MALQEIKIQPIFDPNQSIAPQLMIPQKRVTRNSKLPIKKRHQVIEVLGNSLSERNQTTEQKIQSRLGILQPPLTHRGGSKSTLQLNYSHQNYTQSRQIYRTRRRLGGSASKNGSKTSRKEMSPL